MNSTEKLLQTLTLLAPLATDLRELQDQNLIDAKSLQTTSAAVIDRCRDIGAKIQLAEDRLDGAMSLDDWLSANVANLSTQQAHKCKKLAQGGFTDPAQIIMGFISEPKQVEDKQPSRTKPHEFEQAWGYCVRLYTVEIKSLTDDQQDLLRKNVEKAAEHFGGRIVWE